MELLPNVVHAEYRGGVSLHLVFSDGLAATIDFTTWLEGPVLSSLMDPAYFQKFFLDGGSVAWPNGEDIAPETLHARAKATQAA